MADRIKILLQAKDQTKAAFKSVNKSMKKLDKASAALGVSLGPIAAFASVGAIAVIGRQAIQAADEIQKMSQRLSISTEALSQYRHVAELSGTNFEVLAKGVAKSQRAIADAEDGLTATVRAFEDMNLEIVRVKQLSPEDAFEAMGAAVAAIEDPFRRASAATAIFGRAGKEMLPIFNDGAGAVRAMREEADRLGLTLSQEMADKAADAADAGARLGAAWKGVSQDIAISVVPAFTALADKMAVVVSGFDRLSSFIEQRAQNKAAEEWAGRIQEAIDEMRQSEEGIPDDFLSGFMGKIDFPALREYVSLIMVGTDAVVSWGSALNGIPQNFDLFPGLEDGSLPALKEAPVIVRDLAAATLTGAEAEAEHFRQMALVSAQLDLNLDKYNRQIQVLGNVDIALEDVGEQASESAEIMQSAGEAAADGFSTAIIDAALRSEDALTSLGNVARSVFGMIIKSFLSIGISSLLNPVQAVGGGTSIGPDPLGGAGGFTNSVAPGGGSTVIINGGMNVTANSTLNTDPMSIRRLATQLQAELVEVGRHQG